MTPESRVKLMKDIAYHKQVLIRMKNKCARACEINRQENHIKRLEGQLKNG